eukprot:m.137376 g.137376  ORF g.137376 m.137376 type:complete len:522 (-) comp11630_c0_seq1:134-1699(-)
MSYEPQSVLQVRLEAKDLKRTDALSKSDPFVVVYMQERGVFNEIGRTERVKDVQSCKFTTAINVTYFFELEQTMKFEVYDSDKEGVSDLSKHDFIGQVEVRLGEIVGVHQSVFTGALTNRKGKKKTGTLIVTVEEDRHVRGDVSFRLSCSKLDKKDLFGKSDPYLVLQRASAVRGGWEDVFKSEVVMKTLNPIWKPFQLPLAAVCNGDMDRPLKLTVYDWDRNSAPDLIGEAETTLSFLINNIGETLELINQKKIKKGKKGYKNSGTMRIDSCVLDVKPSFIDYLSAGFQLEFSVAIDFTASNGKPSLPSSLHFINPAQPNEYMQALSAVGNIISDYDSDKWFPGFGFGLKLNGSVSFLHPLNGNMQSPYCQGTQGLIDAYRACLYNVELWGPTNMAPLINHVAGLASTSVGQKKYSVLLIITDGAISDLGATKQAIITASGLPLSIIIVGVGSANFDAMVALDGDDGVLQHNGLRAKRDIVQFVPFRQFSASPASLAREVLAEVPSQFLQYMKENDISPQ